MASSRERRRVWYETRPKRPSAVSKRAEAAKEPSDDGSAVEAGALTDTSVAPTAGCVQNCVKRLNTCLAGSLSDEEGWQRHDCLAGGEGVGF